jgi:two-component system cell cycle sensor histidine kinase/response regulator CckA
MTFAKRSINRPAGVPPEQLQGTLRPLHVLLLEDSAADAELILDELRQAGYELVARRVTTSGEMVEVLDSGSWQVVCLDWSLGALDALAALAVLGVDVPAFLISGVIGQEEVADAIRAGARDVVSKGNLTRLVPAVARELAQVEARRQQRADVEALRQSEQRLRLALDAGGMGTWEWDLLSSELYWSATLEAMFGLEPGGFGGTYSAFIELVHPDDRDLVGASAEQALGQDLPAVVYRAVWPDGTVRWHERKSRRVRDADGRSEVMAGVTFDVTEREEAAQALRESEERFRLIAENARDLIALLDVEGCFRYLSPSCAALLGYPAGVLLGTDASDLIHPGDLPRRRKWGDGEVRELRMRTAAGRWLWVEGLSYVITGQAESHFALIARDISERKQAEVAREVLQDELRQSQKMEAVGQLAGGIAHDFNNLLTVISGYTEILLRRLGREAEGSAEIAEVAKAAEQAARLTRQLLAYSRKQVLEPSALNLNDIVKETQTMLTRVIGENIEFSTTLSDDLGSISADNGQIVQIVMNLVVNARDAMPRGGTLVMATGNATLSAASTSGHSDRSPGEYVALTVTDTGEGMDAATVARIFEPYYTTKDRGAGTGLGLATVDGIVKQSGGHIDVESKPGLGTAIRVYFPRVAGTAQAFRPAPPDELSLAGSETVLLVEDEESLRGIGRRMLELYGYTVLLAADGAAGLELALNHPQPIQLLMTDILMPKMGGIELAERLSILQPELKVLYTSGYNDSSGSPKRVAGAGYLRKPYALEELARTVRHLLDARQGPPETRS